MKNAILFGVPHHSNLGDHAIAIAEKIIIKEKYSECNYQEVAEENICKCIDKIGKYIDEEDILFLHGGGNIGNKYIFSENTRRKVINRFPENKIIVFPQTMYFDKNEEGEKQLEISKKIYCSHNRLFLMAREEVSYKNMKREFPNNHIFLTPDIVTILKEDYSNMERKGALFVIRNDEESRKDKAFLKKIENICTGKGLMLQYTDTASQGNIYQNEREQQIEKIISKYKSAKLIVTDRLHGMIFAAITATPCIAIDNYNHKIMTSAKWFSQMPYIKYFSGKETDEQIEGQIEKFCENIRYYYDNQYSINIFNKVFKIIEEE